MGGLGFFIEEDESELGRKGVSVLWKLEKFEKARGFSMQLRLELPLPGAHRVWERGDKR